MIPGNLVSIWENLGLLKEIRYSVKINWYPVKGIWYPVKETQYPVKEPGIQSRNLVSSRKNLISSQKNLISSQRNLVSSQRNPVSIPRHLVSIPRNLVSIQRNQVSTQRNLLPTQRSLVSIQRNLIASQLSVLSRDSDKTPKSFIYPIFVSLQMPHWPNHSSTCWNSRVEPFQDDVVRKVLRVNPGHYVQEGCWRLLCGVEYISQNLHQAWWNVGAINFNVFNFCFSGVKLLYGYQYIISLIKYFETKFVCSRWRDKVRRVLCKACLK